jgi:hypothetical protein
MTPPQPSPYKGEGANPYSFPLGKGGLRGVVQSADMSSSFGIHVDK